jgi:hypothetical protein
MARLVIVGGGVLGLLTAFRALRSGHAVDLVDPDAGDAISWSGARIVRDVSVGEGGNTRPWRALLSMLGYGEVDRRPVLHLQDGRAVAETGAFCLDTARVRSLLLQKLEVNPSFAWHRTHLARLERDGRRLQLADGQILNPDAAVVAAGKGGAALFEGEVVAVPHWQVCAEFTCSAPVVVPFIQHAVGGGVWGTPALGSQAAKISASDLCFDSLAEAEDFIASERARAAFFARAWQLPEAVDRAQWGETGLCWRIDCYHASCGEQIRCAGPTPVHVACDGNLFKRAPLVTDALLSALKPGVNREEAQHPFH